MRITKGIILTFLWGLAPHAQAQPQANEIRLEGVVAAIAKDGHSFQLEVDSFTVPSGKKGQLAVPKDRQIFLDASSSIYPQGDVVWKLKPNALRVGYGALATGQGSISSGFKARSVELDRKVEGRPIDYFVSLKGSDAGTGSLKNPWRTIQYALDHLPSGFVDESLVLHLGAGDFAESHDKKTGNLTIAHRENLIITGQGAKIEGGTQITTGDYTKSRDTDVVSIRNCQNIEFRNLVIGDDKTWQQIRSSEATVQLYGPSTVKFEAVRIVGPTRETLLDAGLAAAPIALRCGDFNSIVTLENVLVSGHGSFLANPEGKVSSHGVTFARMFGTGYDDHFLFLQTPHSAPRNDRRFTFADCICYEMEGGRGGAHFYLAAGDDGLDKAYFDAPDDGGGNFMVRCRLRKPDTVYEAVDFGQAFLDSRGIAPVSHGIWVDDNPQKTLAGGIRVDNDLKLATRDGFILCAPRSLKSGWTGGYSCPATDTDQGSQ